MNNQLQTILQQIQSSKSPNARLIAVSKFFPSESIRTLHSLGVNDFAENFPQELLIKSLELKQLGIAWHFIGNIQSNKTKIIAENADYVHSLTQIHHAKRLNAQRPKDKPNLKVLIEVNISNELTKHGITEIGDVHNLANEINQLPRLDLVGIMGMASNTQDYNELSNQFNKLKRIAQDLNNQGHNITELSMGTSNDYTIALKYGSTMLRIGSKLFGERKYAKN